MDGYNPTDLLSGEGNSSYWHLLWFFAAPLLYYGGKWLYTFIYANPGDNPMAEPAGGVDAAKFSDVGAMVSPYKPEAKPLDRKPTDPDDPFALARRTAEIMSRYPGWWCVCGGWAVDLHLGCLTREHEDIEVAVLRRDQNVLADFLVGWQPKYAIPCEDEQVAWQQGEDLPSKVHELHTRPLQYDLTHLEILLNDTAGENWIYRRDSRAHLPLSEAVLYSREGIPYLAPEIVLLYKSKNPAEKDHQDFSVLYTNLSPKSQRWLTQALSRISPGHRWFDS